MGIAGTENLDKPDKFNPRPTDELWRVTSGEVIVEDKFVVGLPRWMDVEYANQLNTYLAFSQTIKQWVDDWPRGHIVQNDYYKPVPADLSASMRYADEIVYRIEHMHCVRITWRNLWSPISAILHAMAMDDLKGTALCLRAGIDDIAKKTLEIYSHIDFGEDNERMNALVLLATKNTKTEHDYNAQLEFGMDYPNILNIDSGDIPC